MGKGYNYIMNLPSNYIIECIYQYCNRVKQKDSNIYNFECPICGEGKSAGKKRRGFYFVYENYFLCKNCQRSWSPVNWIMEVKDIKFNAMLSEANEFVNTLDELLIRSTEISNTKNIVKNHILPYDSINLNDPIQLAYYKNNHVVKKCLKYIENRKLNIAVNRPKTFYVSLTDYIHKNRLTIPFYNEKGKIIYYQSRALYPKDEEIAKYFSKKDGEKTLYGVHNINQSMDYIFIFEGPIDSMFCLNGLGACGLSLSDIQEQQLDKYRLHKRIWVLDNQLDNKEVKEQYHKIIESGQNIFFWPPSLSDYKDINDLCVSVNRDQIPSNFIIKNTLNGLQAKLKLLELTK
jgi:hypothetical protein